MSLYTAVNSAKEMADEFRHRNHNFITEILHKHVEMCRTPQK